MIEDVKDVETHLLSREKIVSAAERAVDEIEYQLLRMLWSVIWETKRRRAPNAVVWRKGRGRLPIIPIGDGSNAQLYRSAVEGLDGWLKQHAWNQGTVLLPAPLPESLTHSGSGRASHGHHLLTVAWGLSHRALDVGETIPTDSIPDIEPPPLPRCKDPIWW